MIRFVAHTYPPCWVLKARIQKHRGKPLLFHEKRPGFFYVHYTTHETYSFTSHPKDEAIMVKCLAQGHKCRDRPGRDSNSHVHVCVAKTQNLLSIRNLGSITLNGMPALEPEVAKRMRVLPMRTRITHQLYEQDLDTEHAVVDHSFVCAPYFSIVPIPFWWCPF